MIAADCALKVFMREENMDGFFGGGGRGTALGSKTTIVVVEDEEQAGVQFFDTTIERRATQEI